MNKAIESRSKKDNNFSKELICTTFNLLMSLTLRLLANLDVTFIITKTAYRYTIANLPWINSLNICVFTISFCA